MIQILQSESKKMSRYGVREQWVCVTGSNIIYCQTQRSMIRLSLLRSQIFRETSSKSPLPPYFYESILKNLLQSFAAGTFLKEGPPKNDAVSRPSNPLTNPSTMDSMMAGMKTQAVMMVPQMILMGWINFFFQGFVLSQCCDAICFIFNLSDNWF